MDGEKSSSVACRKLQILRRLFPTRQACQGQRKSTTNAKNAKPHLDTAVTNCESRAFRSCDACMLKIIAPRTVHIQASSPMTDKKVDTLRVAKVYTPSFFSYRCSPRSHVAEQLHCDPKLPGDSRSIHGDVVRHLGYVPQWPAIVSTMILRFGA